ncbi:MAG: response regulator [Deltaproteobacteria bacterium]|nr:response regulator [Deltaproteobacteria bacterium]MBW1919734.1 response regulator [Deltaproteobacteria bacterium]MBW1935879.1 response regulator [Deltaproteobacteria bacterium]MBW1978526.1 response regulator [Deltaproteobacteria bacterium]MBW2045326.1 response regulator [Deltaproteobacteria bacterium]
MGKEPESKTKILVIDDEKSVADILKDLISGRERSVDVCYDGLAAIDRIQRGNYDLIIVDLVIPGVGGLDVLKYAKEINPNTVVIIITGYASLETAIIAVREGAYDYIRKPCKLEEIKIAVENAIDKINLSKENRKLIGKLEDAYGELMTLKKEKGQGGKIASVNFFSSNMPTLDYLYSGSYPSGNLVDKLKALSSLRKKGMLTESEFIRFKAYLLEKAGNER